MVHCTFIWINLPTTSYYFLIMICKVPNIALVPSIIFPDFSVSMKKITK